MKVLGIESSCDETSVAIIIDDVLKANLVASQHFHTNFGGVVPELSSRAHLQIVVPLVKQALNESRLKINDIDLICATAGPGLIGALLVGLSFGRALAYSLNKPFIPVNHIEGHMFSGFLMDEKPEFPMLCLVVSGGHTLLLLVESFTKVYKLGSTIDDAAGEAFDKVSKMIGLGYPGGPLIQKYAETGNPNKIEFPVANLKSVFNFSFSGLKTSVLRYLQSNYPAGNPFPEKDIPDIAASFQNAIVKALIRNSEKALKKYKVNSISIVGGVAANKAISSAFGSLANKYKKKLVVPSLAYCGDNAAMIAFRGARLFEAGYKHNLNVNAFPSLAESHFLSVEQL